MGLEVLIASRGEHSLISEIHQGLHVDLDNPDSALARILEVGGAPFTGVLGCDDATVELAALAADALALPHNPPAAARLTRRKDLARAHLTKSGCAVPAHRLVDLTRSIEDQVAGLTWPCVVKPLNLSASRGVIRANDPAEFIAACDRIRNIIAGSIDEFERTHLLVEAYIDGFEVAFEGYLHQGELKTLALFDKPDPLRGPFFEETIYVTPSSLNQATQSRIVQCVARACRAYGLRTGPIHAEVRVDERDAWILEVASRTIGGDCSRCLDMGENFNLEEFVISLAIGKPQTARTPDEARGVMMIPIKERGVLRRVEGLGDARGVANIESVDILVHSGHELVPLPEGNQYPGYIFARGQSPGEVVSALREANSRLNFVVAPLFRLVAE
ncbi:MAG: biotin carboxylase [Gammaproteobacteria bacterium]|jgi:biotin carboxylase